MWIHNRCSGKAVLNAFAEGQMLNAETGDLQQVSGPTTSTLFTVKEVEAPEPSGLAVVTQLS